MQLFQQSCVPLWEVCTVVGCHLSAAEFAASLTVTLALSLSFPLHTHTHLNNGENKNVSPLHHAVVVVCNVGRPMA